MTNKEKLIAEIEALKPDLRLRAGRQSDAYREGMTDSINAAIEIIRQQPEPQEVDMITLQKIGAEMHYPACWDTVAYPTIFHAIYEMASCCECEHEHDLTKVDASTHKKEAVLQFTASTSPTNTTELEKVRETLEATIREFSLVDEYANKVFDENISNSAVTKAKQSLTIINRMLGKGE